MSEVILWLISFPFDVRCASISVTYDRNFSLIFKSLFTVFLSFDPLGL